MSEEQTREMIGQFQLYQQQMQSVLIQKETVGMQLLEVSKALEELNSTKNEKAYKVIGQVMISKTVEDLKNELTETKEAMEIRIKSLEGMESKITEKLKELEAELKKLVK